MRNSLKIILALILGVFLFSFQNQSEVSTYTSTKKVFLAADTLTWKLLGEIKYLKKKFFNRIVEP